MLECMSYLKFLFSSLKNNQDLLIFFQIIIAIPLTWFFLLGWQPDHLIWGQDALMWVPRLQQILDDGSGWKDLLYRPDSLGGITISSIVGITFYNEALAFLGFDAVDVLNFTLFLIQTLFAFFSLSLIRFLRSTSSSPPPPMSVFENLLAIWVTAFAPYIAWRVTAGHFNILIGMLAFVVAASTLVQFRLKQISFVWLLLFILATVFFIPSDGHQMKLYSLVFGIPLFAALIFNQSTQPQRSSNNSFLILTTLAITTLGCLAVVAPQFFNLYQFTKGPEVVRSTNQGSIIFSYITSTWTDWATSMALSIQSLPSDRAPGFFHEVNFPLGPFLLMGFLLLLARRAWGIMAGLILSAVIALLLSVNFEPVVHGITLLIPPMDSFRVPSRAILIFLFALTVFSVAEISVSIQKPTLPEKLRRYQSLILLSVFLVFFILISLIPTGPREALYWVSAVAASIIFLIQPKLWKKISLGLIILFAISQLLAFRERLEPTTAKLDLLTIPMLLQKDLGKSFLPTERVTFQTELQTFRTNTALAFGYSSLAGYFYPSRRFLELVSALEQMPISPTTVYFPINETSRCFSVLQQLYNVQHSLTYQDQKLNLLHLAPTLGHAWFSTHIESAQTIQEIATKLQTEVSKNTKLSAEKLHLLAADLAALPSEFPRTISEECQNAKVSDLAYERKSGSFTMTTSSTQHCPMTLATNYFLFLQAQTESDERLTVFPSSGALTGILIPPGTHQIRLSAKLEPLPGSVFFSIAGYALMILGILLFFIFQRTEQIKTSANKNHS